MAEFENFRKRSEKEKTQMYEVGAKGILEKILPVVDNFERGLDALSEEEKLAFAEEDYQVNKELFGQLIPEMVDVLERKADGRLRSKLLYSRKDVKSVLGRIMQGINHYIENNGDEG